MEERDTITLNAFELKNISDMLTEKAALWFKENFKVHSDWTGTYVEYKQKCDSVDDLITKFVKDMRE